MGNPYGNNAKNRSGMGLGDGGMGGIGGMSS